MRIPFESHVNHSVNHYQLYSITAMIHLEGLHIVHGTWRLRSAPIAAVPTAAAHAPALCRPGLRHWTGWAGHTLPMRKVGRCSRLRLIVGFFFESGFDLGVSFIEFYGDFVWNSAEFWMGFYCMGISKNFAEFSGIFQGGFMAHSTGFGRE